MAHKPFSKNTEIPNEKSDVRKTDKIDIKNDTVEMGINPRHQDDFYNNIPIKQIATKQDIKSLEKDIKSLEKDIQIQKENTDIKFSAVNSKIDSLRNEMKTNHDSLSSEMNTKFENLDNKFDGLGKDLENTMFKLFFLAMGGFAAFTVIIKYFFG